MQFEEPRHIFRHTAISLVLAGLVCGVTAYNSNIPSAAVAVDATIEDPNIDSDKLIDELAIQAEIGEDMTELKGYFIKELKPQQVYSLEEIQDKCTKTGITAETVELSTELHFNPEDVSQPSNMTLEQLKKFTKAYCPCWVGLEEEILPYDKQLNLIFLLAVARGETWAGEKCVGDYNSFNIRHGDGSYVDYTSYIEGIDDFVQLILNLYLAPEGIWHEGVSIYSIGIHYAQPLWAPGITDLGYEIYDYLK